MIDQALHLFGQPLHVYAEVERRRPETQVDDDTFVVIVLAEIPGPLNPLVGVIPGQLLAMYWRTCDRVETRITRAV